MALGTRMSNKLRAISAEALGTRLSLMQRFHLEGNFLPEGNLGLWKEIWKEITFGRKRGRKYCYKEGNEKEIYFIS